MDHSRGALSCSIIKYKSVIRLALQRTVGLLRMAGFQKTNNSLLKVLPWSLSDVIFSGAVELMISTVSLRNNE